jgi:hypothetical protein
MALYHEFSTDDEVLPVADVVTLERSLAVEGGVAIVFDTSIQLYTGL